MLAAVASSPVSAAALMNNVGHISVARTPNNFSNNNIGAGNQYFTPSTSHTSHGPKAKKWVCGPLVNWDGTPHCHRVPTLGNANHHVPADIRFGPIRGASATSSSQSWLLPPSPSYSL